MIDLDEFAIDNIDLPPGLVDRVVGDTERDAQRARHDHLRQWQVENGITEMTAENWVEFADSEG